MDSLTNWLGREGYLPHGYCFVWDPTLLHAMVGSDAFIALAYFSIPVTLLYFLRQRSDVSMRSVVVLFSLFIFSCGATHVLDIWTIWQPVYDLQALVKVATALSSVATAIVLWILMPRALRIPSVAQLSGVIDAKEIEIERRRKAEHSLLDARNDLAITLASLGAAIITTEAEGYIVHMNAVAERVTGWPLVEARGRILWDIWCPEGMAESLRKRSPVDVIMEHGLSPRVALRRIAVSRQGERTPVEVSGSPTRAADGTVRGVVLVFRDMTEIDRADAESRQLAAIVHSSNEAIIGLDLTGTITTWNRAAELLFGYAAQAAIGTGMDRMIPTTKGEEEQRARLVAGLAVDPFDSQGLRKDGVTVAIGVTAWPIQDAEGRTSGVSLLVRDISSRLKEEEARAAVAQLLTENHRIIEATRLKSAFLANMSHELRTPLNAIIGFADLLQDGAVDPGSPQFGEFLGYVGTSGRHLLQIINDILDLSKIEAGRLEFASEQLDLREVLEAATRLLQQEAEQKGLLLRAEIAQGLDTVELDVGRLKQVLYNYLSNAIKFTPEGGSVTLRAMRLDDEMWRLEVEDSGVGIHEQDIPRLFVDFQQLDSGYTKKHQGTGLGLALTRRLVEAQGGRVGVRSRAGLGSTFFADLPVIFGFRLSGKGDTPNQAGSALVLLKGRVGASRLVRLLSGTGLNAEVVESLEQLRSRMRVRPYDAVSVDLGLSEGRALAVLNETRRERTPNDHAPVISLTVTTDANDVVGYVVADLIRKPPDRDVLEAVLRRVDHLSRGETLRVLVVDGEPGTLSLASDMLANLGAQAFCVSDVEGALELLDTVKPHAMIVDLLLPRSGGFDLLRRLRRLDTWRSLPVFAWTNEVLTVAEEVQLGRAAAAAVEARSAAVEELWRDLEAVPLHLKSAGGGVRS